MPSGKSEVGKRKIPTSHFRLPTSPNFTMRKKLYIYQWMAILLLLSLPTISYAQNLPVSGVVTSVKKGKPIKGVLVEVKGTRKSVKTDSDGQYEIPVDRNFYTPSPAPVLIFTHKDYEEQAVEVVDDREINVSLFPVGEKDMNSFLTGTASGIANEGVPFSAYRVDDPLLINQVPAANIASGLQGKVPGLVATQAGFEPGQNAYLQLRAANSLANGQQPLILVDGIYLQNAMLADFNADDIEKIEVLPGAAASAVYGSQGGNGVIQIFTRTGKSLGVGDTRITYRGEYGFSEPANTYALNEFTNREIVNPQGPQPILGPENEDLIHDTPLPNLQNYQEDLLFQNGTYSSHYLTMQGKTTNTHFMVSGQRFSDEGILQGQEGLTRHSLRANLDHQAGKRLHLSFRSQYSSQQKDGLPDMAAGAADYLFNALAITPIFSLQAPNEEDGSDFDWDIDNTGGNITNPLYLRDNIKQSVSRNRLAGSFDARLQAREWLSFDYQATLDYLTNQYEYFVDKGYLSTTAPGNFSNLVTAGVSGSNGGAIRQNTSLQNYFTSTAGFRLEKSWLGLSTRLRAGFLYENGTHNFRGAAGEDLSVEGVQSLDNPQQNLSITSEEEQLIGYNTFLVADADYKNKFFFSGAYRREQSSLFGEDAGWPSFYRIGGAYRMSEDINLKFFQELKFHAAIGTAGIRPAFAQRFETYALSNGVLSKQTLGNEQLLPARSQELEVGINMTFLKGFSLNGAYTQVTTEDQIIFSPLSGGAGFQGQWRNAGTVEADVYEASLNIDLAKLMKVRNRGFSWDITGVGQRVEQVITSLGVSPYTTGPGLPNTDIFLMQEGLAPGTMAGEVFATSIEDLANQPEINLTELAVNDLGYIVRSEDMGTPDERPIKVLDESGNPVVRPIGDINPDFRLGIANRLAFKGLQLYALFDWKMGGDIYNYTRQQLYQNERHADLSANDQVAAPFYTEGLYNNGIANHHFVEDASFFMLREASISYTFDQSKLSFFGDALESIQLSLIGRNLFTKTDYSGFHPDISSGMQGGNLLSSRQPNGLGSNIYTPGGDTALFGIDGFGYPARRTFTFSLSVTL